MYSCGVRHPGSVHKGKPPCLLHLPRVPPSIIVLLWRAAPGLVAQGKPTVFLILAAGATVLVLLRRAAPGLGAQGETAVLTALAAGATVLVVLRHAAPGLVTQWMHS